MARDERIERLLVAWAQWLRSGDASGYSRLSVLHPEWSPPAPGQLPSMPLSRGDVAQVLQVHAAVRRMSVRMANTLMVHYCMPGLSVAEQCQRLECAPATLAVRICAAHRRLADELAGVSSLSATTAEFAG